MRWRAAITQPCDENVLLVPTAVVPCPRRSQPWILAATILGSSLAFIDGTVVNIALPALQTDLNATVIDVQWVIEAYALLLAALLLVGGSLGDLYGRKRIFGSGVFLFAAASAYCGFAPTVRQLIFGRVIQGVGAALLVPGSLAIISASFGQQDRGRAIGTWSGFTSITTAIGPVLGGWLIEQASWRWAFFVNLPLAATVLVLTAWHVPESRIGRRNVRLDWTGAVLATFGLAGLVYALIESSKSDRKEPLIIAALLLGGLALASFMAVETRTNAPLLPLGLFRTENFSGANLLTLLLYSALNGVLFFFPLNLIQVQGYTATAAGAALLPFIVSMFLFSRWSGGMVDRYGARRPLIFGPVVAAAGFALFAVPSVGGSYWVTFLPAVGMLGLGMAMSVAPLTTTVMNAVPEEQAGIASGVNNAVSRLAAVLSIAALGVIAVHTFDAHLNVRLQESNVEPEVREEIRSQTIRLAAIKVPSRAGDTERQEIRRFINESFVAGFRFVMLIACGLALGSAVTAWLTIRDKPS